jgi:V/A-type H+-transporting ATPase subunit I
MDLVGVFGDMLSYMRLFAVGFTAFILAMLSNMLLVQDTGIVLTILGVAIALFGHTLNLVLGILAILVHGFRLHLLEGSKHAEIESAGVPYQPLNGV